MTISIKKAKEETKKAQNQANNAALDSLSTINKKQSTIDTHVANLNVGESDKEYLTHDYYARLKALNIQKDLIANHLKIASDIKVVFDRDMKTMENNLQLYKKYDALGQDNADEKYSIAEDEYSTWYGVKYDEERLYSLYTGRTGGGDKTFAIMNADKFRAKVNEELDLDEGHLAHVEGGGHSTYTYGVIYNSFVENLNYDTTQHDVDKYHKSYAYTYSDVIVDYEPAVYNNQNVLIRDAVPIQGTFKPTKFHITPAADINTSGMLKGMPSLFLDGAPENTESMSGANQNRVGQIVLGKDGGYHIVTPTMFEMDINEFLNQGAASQAYNFAMYGGAAVEGSGDVHSPDEQNLLDQSEEYGQAVSDFISVYQLNVHSFLKEYGIPQNGELGKQLLGNIPSFNPGDYKFHDELENAWERNE